MQLRTPCVRPLIHCTSKNNDNYWNCKYVSSGTLILPKILNLKLPLQKKKNNFKDLLHSTKKYKMYQFKGIKRV